MGAHLTSRDVKTPLSKGAPSEARSNPPSSMRQEPGGGNARGRQRLVQVAMIPGDLVTEPVRGLARPGVVLGWKLDLRDDQAVEIALVDVHLDLEIAGGNEVSPLLTPPSLRQRPEPLEG